MEISKRKNKSKADLNEFLKGVIEEEDSYFSNHYKPKPEVPGSASALETRNKGLIKDEQSTNKPVTGEPVTVRETRNKPVTDEIETRNGKVIKDEQSTNKPVMETYDLSLDKVSSFQRSILEVIFSEVQANPFSKETRPLNIQQFGAFLGIVDTKGFESLRIVILRLEKAGFLIKTKVKTGRSGWTQYSLPNQTFEQLLRLTQIQKPVIKDEQSTNKPVTKPVMEPPRKKEGIELNLSFFLPEALKQIGLRESMIKTDREDLQDCLNHLAYSVEHKELKSSNPLGTVISVLNSNKAWVAGKLIEEQNKVLAEQERRIVELKNLKEQQLRNAFEIYKMENPDFLEEMRAESKLNLGEAMLEKLAFVRFQQDHGKPKNSSEGIQA